MVSLLPPLIADDARRAIFRLRLKKKEQRTGSAGTKTNVGAELQSLTRLQQFWVQRQLFPRLAAVCAMVFELFTFVLFSKLN